MRRCNAASSSSTAAARGVDAARVAESGVVGVEARAEGPRGGGGGTTTPARDPPPPENVRRRAGLGERREIGVDARLAGLGDRRVTEVGVEARRRRAAASAAPVAWRAMGDGDLVVRRAAARGGEKKKPPPTLAVCLFHTQERYAQPVEAMRADVASLTDNVRKALLEMNDAELLASFPRLRFVPASNGDYEPIEATAKAIGLLD